jgi:hypothetical protein
VNKAGKKIDMKSLASVMFKHSAIRSISSADGFCVPLTMREALFRFHPIVSAKAEMLENLLKTAPRIWFSIGDPPFLKSDYFVNKVIIPQ